jgi:hypothetical protein
MMRGRLRRVVRRLNGMRPWRLAATVIVAGGILVPTDAVAQATAPTGEAGLRRLKQQLEAPTTIRDAVEHAPPIPTFRTSVTERVDIWKFWGEPDEVAAHVRARGGAWHSEFQSMVTPDEVKNYGASIGNAETLQMAATSMAFALGLKYLTGAISGAIDGRARRKAKADVQQELAAFCAATPGACADPPVTPLTPP